jgi:hypothetical protein
MQVRRYSLGIALLCDFPKVTNAERLCKYSHCGTLRKARIIRLSVCQIPCIHRGFVACKT